MKTVTLYEAFDGQKFETAEACRAYEAEHVEARLVGMTLDQIRAAIAGEDTGLRDALEEVGRRCSVARRDAGEFRRAPKRTRAGATEQDPEAAPKEPASVEAAAAQVDRAEERADVE